MRKIHCEEIFGKPDLDEETTLETLREMIGFYYPDGNNRWEVVMIEGEYNAESQFEAQVISSLEEIKALLLKRGEK